MIIGVARGGGNGGWGMRMRAERALQNNVVVVGCTTFSPFPRTTFIPTHTKHKIGTRNTRVFACFEHIYAHKNM